MENPHFSGSASVGPKWNTGSVVGVIGGLGEMGRLFSEFFISHGFEVRIADLDTQLTPEQAIGESDIVLFAVPLHETVDIIRKYIAHTRPGQLVMDLASLKSAPVREMLRSPASVVGLHPMFGGRVSSLSGQTLAACPVRIDAADWEWLRGLFSARGVRVKECSPEEHDRMMSIIQVLFHLTTMLIGRTLRKLGVDINETMEYTSPSYRIEMNLVGRIFAQNPELYAAITQMNPHSPDIFAALKDGLETYEQFCRSGDLHGFMEDFKKSGAHLGDFCRDAYLESSEILDFSVGLANNKKAGSGESIPKLRLRLKAGALSGFLSLFQVGCFIKVPAGSTLLEMLDCAGFSREYLEKKVQTVFVNGSAIDDFGSAMVGEGAVVALSAAMPGLAGAILRRGSPISPMRSRTAARDETHHPRGRRELVRLKLFNTVAEDMGPVLLQNGVIFNRADIESFLSGRRALLHDALLEAELDGNPAASPGIFERSFICPDHVLLSVSVLSADK